jgi:hypothetical protein
MASEGSLVLENKCKELVRKAFADKGFELLTFTCQGKFSDKVTDKIDQRLQINTNLSVIDQQILEQKKLNELEELKTEFALIQNRVFTEAYLDNKRLDKWDGHNSSTVLGNNTGVNVNLNHK